ncbi:diguanylate cyclase [Microvirga sp. M2]|uniref:sensor domain-containing diguanylate cyclase n=1 Tax=Microvirga sp. M2 TaxID=3073270 RepID=UPI0039C45A29
MNVFPSDPDSEALRGLVGALTESGQAVSLYDAEDRLRYANTTYRDLFMGDYDGPLTFTDILRHANRNRLGVRIDDDIEAFIARTLPRRRSPRRKSFETDLVNGRWFWIEHTILPNGWVLSVGADISTLKHNEKSLRQAHEAALVAARTDLLTDLPNRRHILEHLDEALVVDKQSASGLCVAIIDIDHFKAVNDTYGHDAGDAVLRHFAQGCRERLRDRDLLGRIGGEEFLLLLPGIRLSDAVGIIDRVRAGFPPHNLPDDARDVRFTFSAGVTEALPHDDRSSILYRADRALYAAKAEGRNCTRIRFENEIPPLRGETRS